MTRRQVVSAGALLAIVLTACDALFHVRTETLVYHWEPQVGGQAVIVPVTFFVAAVAMLELTRRAAGAAPAAGARRAVGSAAIVLGAYLVSGLVDDGLAPAYAGLLVAWWVVRVLHRREPVAPIAVGVLIAAGGVVAESALSAVGEFDYVAPDVLGVPWWLFPLYLHGALAVADLVAYRLRVAPPSTGSMTPVR